VLTSPIRNIIPNLVYSARGDEVDTVIIDEKVVMEEGKLLTIDEKEEIKKAQQASENIAKRAKEDIWNADSAMLKMMKNGML
jgi:5-methylthioadenosine/S-adenosylhomocysteine deaminase